MSEPVDSARSGGSERGVYEALRSALDEAASASDVVDRAETPDGVEYRVRGRAVAFAGDRSVAFLVGEPVALAAGLTANAGASARGSDWVELRPSALDRFALDRAGAWFELAVRRARSAPS